MVIWTDSGLNTSTRTPQVAEGQKRSPSCRQLLVSQMLATETPGRLHLLDVHAGRLRGQSRPAVARPRGALTSLLLGYFSLCLLTVTWRVVGQVLQQAADGQLAETAAVTQCMVNAVRFAPIQAICTNNVLRVRAVHDSSDVQQSSRCTPPPPPPRHTVMSPRRPLPRPWSFLLTVRLMQSTDS